MNRYTLALAVVIAAAFTVPLAAPAVAQNPQQAAQNKGPQKKKAMKRAPRKVERLACRLGTEDEHARIAVQLVNGKVDSFAYYSKWKPRTCSIEVSRNDAYSSWEDNGNMSVVTLIEDKGAFLIDHGQGRYHFIFRDLDRERYCGMDGKVNGSLTIFRGRPQCTLQGIMDRDPPEPEPRPVIVQPGTDGTQPAAGAGEAGEAGPHPEGGHPAQNILETQSGEPRG